MRAIFSLPKQVHSTKIHRLPLPPRRRRHHHQIILTTIRGGVERFLHLPQAAYREVGNGLRRETPRGLLLKKMHRLPFFSVCNELRIVKYSINSQPTEDDSF